MKKIRGISLTGRRQTHLVKKKVVVMIAWVVGKNIQKTRGVKRSGTGGKEG